MGRKGKGKENGMDRETKNGAEMSSVAKVVALTCHRLRQSQEHLLFTYALLGPFKVVFHPLDGFFNRAKTVGI